jgi:hypothetical protein
MDKLALDSARQSVVCIDTTWQLAPSFSDINNPGNPCDQPGRMSISGDGYLIICHSDSRTWGLYQG